MIFVGFLKLDNGNGLVLYFFKFISLKGDNSIYLLLIFFNIGILLVIFIVYLIFFYI